MSETLLLEIGLEEVPAKYVRQSSEQLKDRMVHFLNENRLFFGEVTVYATPRRLAVKVQDVSERQEDLVEVLKGPAKKIALTQEGGWSRAAEGFVRGKGLTTEDIFFESVNGTEYVHVKKETAGLAAREILTSLHTVIESMTFPIAMHWANHTFKYIRPIHWIVALYGSEVLEVSVLDIKADRISRGHRFLGQDAVIPHAEEYEALLEKEYVIAGLDKRKALIQQQIDQLAEESGWMVPEDDDLLEEITALVEFPTAFYGPYDPKYLALPDEVLVTSMKGHQRYFEVKDQQGTLLPYFVSVRNGNQEHLQNVVRGNQKVLTARLEDGLFFFEEDKKIPISKAVEKLAHVSFHARIGSLADKMAHAKEIAAKLADRIALPQAERHHLMRAADIYKFDLVSNMVGEFPELQGIMGEVYALQQGEAAETAAAVREHYLPVSSEGELPQSRVGAVLAVSDKLDSIISFFLQGMIPTGSNDPYALRRQMMGIIQIFDKFGWAVDFRIFLAELLLEVYGQDPAGEPAVLNELLAFAKGRIEQKLQTADIRYDIQEAVLQSTEADINKLIRNAKTVQFHVDEADFKETVEALSRVVNITAAVEALPEANAGLLQTASEKNLYVQINHLQQLLAEADEEGTYQALKALVPYITAYFDENMVMVEDLQIRANRLATLKKLACSVLKMMDVSRIVVK